MNTTNLLLGLHVLVLPVVLVVYLCCKWYDRKQSVWILILMWWASAVWVIWLTPQLNKWFPLGG